MATKKVSEILARLCAKIGDIEKDYSQDEQKLSQEELQQKERRNDLKAVYEEQCDVIGIPKAMKDPVEVLCQIGREAKHMYFKLTRTELDFYGSPDNWIPRLSVNRFKSETEESIKALQEAQDLFLELTSRTEEVKTDDELRQKAVDQVD